MFRVASLALLLLISGSLDGLIAQDASEHRPAIPTVWADGAMKDLELPLAEPEFTPKHVSEEYYYQIPVRPIYKSYPVYHPEKEPKGYVEWLKSREPELVWDADKLKTKEDWIRAGEVVFDAPIGYGSPMARSPARDPGDDLYVREKAFYEAVQPPLASDGTLPFYRYVIREKGVIDVGMLSCGMCHTRVMPDGSVIKGAQGNFPFDKAMAYDARSGGNQMAPINRRLSRRLWFTPWFEASYFANLADASGEDIAKAFESTPGGVITRHRAGPWARISVPDLIGVSARRYLDRTGLQQNRGLVDLMRYAALNQGGDDLSDFGGYVPLREMIPPELKVPPDRKIPPERLNRYSDEQLYALVLYIDALQAPPNPNPFNEEAAAGKAVFEREGCAGCHIPPLYSNNKLTPAVGFKVPPEHKDRYDILDIVVGTDPALTLTTRRGTGYYKVPSLKGVWYREYFGHGGWSKTLEDWFDPARLNDDYEPTGATPQGKKKLAVSGHEFGLRLSEKDRGALLAFLRTL